MNSKWITVLNVRAKTTQLLGENIGVNFSVILDMTIKAQVTNENTV